MHFFLRVLLVGLQVLTLEVSCDYANDKRLLEEYNSKLFCVLLSKECFRISALDMSVRCLVKEVNSLKSRNDSPGRI